jgi:hypothetical protein
MEDIIWRGTERRKNGKPIFDYEMRFIHKVEKLLWKLEGMEGSGVSQPGCYDYWEEGYEYREFHVSRSSELPFNFFGEFKISKGMITFETNCEPYYLGNGEMMGSWPPYPEEWIKIETVIKIRFDERIGER